jgi:hypothetical protein
VWRSSTAHLTGLSQKKTVGDGEKLLTYLNSALEVLLGTDSFPRVPKTVKFCCPVKNVNIRLLTLFSHLTWLSQKKTVGDGEKLLTYLNSALKVLSGLDIFPRGTKKKLNFVAQCIQPLVYLIAVYGHEGGHLVILRNGSHFAVDTAEHYTDTKLTSESQTVTIRTTRLNILSSTL